MTWNHLIRRAVADWIERRRQKRLDRIANAYERERAAIIRQIESRREGGREWRPKLGDLRRATCAALAAETGQDWPKLVK